MTVLARVFRVLATHPDGDRVTVEIAEEGVAVALDGNVGCCATPDGALLVRTTRVGAHLAGTGVGGPDEAVTAYAPDGPRHHGWLRVAGEEVADVDAVRPWVSIGLAVAGSLPPRPSAEVVAPGSSIVEGVSDLGTLRLDRPERSDRPERPERAAPEHDVAGHRAGA